MQKSKHEQVQETLEEARAAFARALGYREVEDFNAASEPVSHPLGTVDDFARRTWNGWHGILTDWSGTSVNPKGWTTLVLDYEREVSQMKEQGIKRGQSYFVDARKAGMCEALHHFLDITLKLGYNRTWDEIRSDEPPPPKTLVKVRDDVFKYGHGAMIMTEEEYIDFEIYMDMYAIRVDRPYVHSAENIVEGYIEAVRSLKPEALRGHDEHAHTGYDLTRFWKRARWAVDLEREGVQREPWGDFLNVLAQREATMNGGETRYAARDGGGVGRDLREGLKLLNGWDKMPRNIRGSSILDALKEALERQESQGPHQE